MEAMRTESQQVMTASRAGKLAFTTLGCIWVSFSVYPIGWEGGAIFVDQSQNKGR